MCKTLRRLAALGLGLAMWAAPSLGLEIKNGSTAIKVNVLMISSADHTSPLAGATLTVTKSKNGGAFAALSGTVAETANGWYAITLASGDVDTNGDLILHATATGGDPSDRLVEVVAYDPTNATTLGLTNLDAAVSTRSTYAGGAVASVTGAVGSVTGNVGGNVVGSTGSVVGAVGSVTSGVTVTTNNDKSGYSLASVATIAAAVWDLATSGHTTSGTFGAAMNAAGAAGDPWSTALPGSYGAGTAGNLVGGRIDAAISTRATPASILASPANLLVTDSQGRVTTPTYAVRATVQAGSTSSSVVVAGLPTNASYAGQHIYRPNSTGEARRISGDTLSGSNHVLTFTGAATPFDAAFGAAPPANEVVSIGP